MPLPPAPGLPPGLHRITPRPRSRPLAVVCQSRLLYFQEFCESVVKPAMVGVFALQKLANTKWGLCPWWSENPFTCAPLILGQFLKL